MEPRFEQLRPRTAGKITNQAPTKKGFKKSPTARNGSVSICLRKHNYERNAIFPWMVSCAPLNRYPAAIPVVFIISIHRYIHQPSPGPGPGRVLLLYDSGQGKLLSRSCKIITTSREEYASRNNKTVCLTVLLFSSCLKFFSEPESMKGLRSFSHKKVMNKLGCPGRE